MSKKNKNPHLRDPEEPAELEEMIMEAVPEAVDLSPQLAEKQAEIEKLQNALLYERAELENFKRRMEKRYQDALRYASEPLIRDLLPVIDNLERAAQHTEGGDTQAMKEGLSHIVSQLRAALLKNNVAEVQAEGAKFDPHVHEAVAQVPGEENNKVVAVHEKGYTLHDRLLRPARVLVSRLATQ
jgi:molecular chaperone GrpE